MSDTYQYTPELFNLLVDTIPLLVRSKKDVVLFFRGAGVSDIDLADVSNRVINDRENINKYEIARTILQRINEKGDNQIRVRKEIIRRVVQYEEFSSCYPENQLKAKGLVATISKVVNIKDSFTRMSQEREKEREIRASETREKIQQQKQRKESIEQTKKDFYALFLLNDKPQERGKLLEKVLNKIFSIYDILIKEDFKRTIEGVGVVEQIDGIASFEGSIFLVEMKWLSRTVGVDDLAPHLCRLYRRADAKGIFISSNGYAKSAITHCEELLSDRIIILCTLEEIIRLLERDGCLKDFFMKKIQAAIIDKKPFIEILS